MRLPTHMGTVKTRTETQALHNQLCADARPVAIGVLLKITRYIAQPFWPTPVVSMNCRECAQQVRRQVRRDDECIREACIATCHCALTARGRCAGAAKQGRDTATVWPHTHTQRHAFARCSGRLWHWAPNACGQTHS